MDEAAIVLRALEVRAAKQLDGMESLSADAELLEVAIAEERAAMSAVAVAVGWVPSESPPPTVPTSVRAFVAEPLASWQQNRDEAVGLLRAEGIDPASVVLDRSVHRLSACDVCAALSFGVVGAVLPSLGAERGGTVFDGFRRIQMNADAGNLPHLVQRIFGDHPAAFMDAGAQGLYHRFVAGHDLLTALPKGISALGFGRGVLEVFQHLLRDAFGATGVPLPGSTSIGNAVAQGLGGASIADIISPKKLSQFAAIRMTDGVATGTTALLLWGYQKVRDIPATSMRRSQMGVLAHGLTMLAMAALTAIPGIAVRFPFRSRINYLSFMAMAKHAWSLHKMTVQLRAENNALAHVVENGMRALEAMRAGDDQVQCLDTEAQAIARAFAA